MLAPLIPILPILFTIVNIFIKKTSYTELMLLKKIGKNIRVLRKKENLSQIDLAVAVGIDRSYLSEIENGKRNVTIMLLQNIATILTVKIEDLLH